MSFECKRQTSSPWAQGKEWLYWHHSCVGHGICWPHLLAPATCKSWGFPLTISPLFFSQCQLHSHGLDCLSHETGNMTVKSFKVYHLRGRKILLLVLIKRKCWPEIIFNCMDSKTCERDVSRALCLAATLWRVFVFEEESGRGREGGKIQTISSINGR